MKKITFILVACLFSMFSMATTNLVVNGSFESDVVGSMPAGWTLTKSKAVSVIDAKAQDGSNAILADAAVDGQIRLEQYVNDAKKDKKYRFSFYYTDYTNAGNGLKNYSNAGKNFTSGYMETDGPLPLDSNNPGEWKQYSCEFTAQTDTVKISIRCYVTATIDNVVMEEISGGTDPDPVTETADIAGFIALANETAAVTITGKVNVAYVNEYTKKDGSLSSSVFLQDASGWILMYSNALSNLTTGQSLTGLSGMYSQYFGTNQILNATIPAPESDVVVAPAAVSISDLNTDAINRYIKISDVTIIEKTVGEFTNQYAVDADNHELWVFDKFKTGTALTVGSKYDLEGIITVFKNELELAYTKVTTAGDDVELVNADQLSFDGVMVLNPNKVEVYVYSMTGKLLKSGVNDIDISDLNTGVYMVVSSNGMIKIMK